MPAIKLTFGFVIGVFLILTALPVNADIYRYRDENGKWHFTNINSDRRYKLYLRTFPEKPSVFIEKYGSIIEQASQTFNLESSLIKAVIKAESGFDHEATSEKGAQGLMQLMPETADELAVEDPYNPEENIFGGARYLSSLMGRFNNNLQLALAAYNAGPERVESYNGVPPFTETKEFIKRVLNYLREYQSGNK
jgi:soluble lytic murein transglycosylase